MAASQADVNTIISLINAKDIEALSAEDFEMFQYQGFDPMKCALALVSVKKKKSISNDDFIGDVIKMIAIGMIKGNVNDHNLQKMTTDGKDSVTNLSSRYGIHHGGGKGQSSNVITYPRVMATFPDLAIKITKVIGGKSFLGGPMISSRLPPFMQCQVFPAIIPHGCGLVAKSFLMTAALAYSLDQTIQISQIKDPKLDEISGTQANFVRTGHNSPVPTEEVRVNVFNDLEIEESYEAIKAVVETYKEKVDKTVLIPEKSAFLAALKG